MYRSPDGVRTLIDAALVRPDVLSQTLVFDTVAPWCTESLSGSEVFAMRTPNSSRRLLALTARFVAIHGVFVVDEQSVVALARRASRGGLAAIIGAVDAVDAVGPGHRAMVLRTYRRSSAAHR